MIVKESTTAPSWGRRRRREEEEERGGGGGERGEKGKREEDEGQQRYVCVGASDYLVITDLQEAEMCVVVNGHFGVPVISTGTGHPDWLVRLEMISTLTTALTIGG